MNDLEQLISDALHARDREAPDGAHLLSDVRAKVAVRRRRDWTSAVMAALATAGVVTAVIAVLPDERHAAPPVAETPAAVEAIEAPPPTPPPDTQAVSYHGVEVFVPADWGVDATRCGTPMRDTVIIEDGRGQLACLVAEPPGLTVVRVSPAVDSPRAAVATEAVTVSGQPARRGVGTPAGRGERELAVLVLPGPGVVVSVESPDAKLAAELLDAVRIVAVDSVGCRDRYTLAGSRLPYRPGAAAQLVLGEPTTARICRYADDWLGGSAAVAPAEVVRLVGILNALPVGTSTPGPGYFASEEICAEDLHRGFVIQFGYDDAAPEPLDVVVHISGCDGLSASNGMRTTKINEPLVSFLLTAVGYDGHYPNPTELR